MAARVHEKKGAGPVGAFRLALAEAGLTEKRALLIADQSGDGDPVRQEVEPSCMTKDGVIGANFWQSRPGYTKESKHFRVPTGAPEIHEQGT